MISCTWSLEYLQIISDLMYFGNSISTLNIEIYTEILYLSSLLEKKQKQQQQKNPKIIPNLMSQLFKPVTKVSTKQPNELNPEEWPVSLRSHEMSPLSKGGEK